MSVPNPFKLERLTITKVGENHTPDPSQKFEVMFNPTQYSVRYQSVGITEDTLTPGEKGIRTSRQSPRIFSVNIVLDGTGVTDDGLTTGLGLLVYSVKERVKKFIEVCYTTQEHPHEPNHIQVQWGIVDFTGQLQSVNINYTLFDQSGNPLRATLDIEIASDEDKQTTRLSSPDLTHTRTVKAGDSLPLLAKEIYGSSRYYLLVAEANGLDDFRNIKQGTVLHFPPLTNRLKV